MKTEKWTTEKGTKIEMEWTVKVYDLAVVKDIKVIVNGKNYVSDGEIRNGNLVIKQTGITTAQLPVSQGILDEIEAEYKAGKASIDNNQTKYNDYLRRMSQLGY